jgi:hypothetical protein
MNIYGGVALVGGEVSVSLPCLFTPGGKASDTHWKEGWVDPRAGQDDMEKWKLLALQGPKSDSSIVQPVSSSYTDCATAAHNIIYI